MRFATKLATIAAALTIASASAARNAPAAPAPAAAVLSTVTAPSFAPAMHAVLVQDAKIEVDVNDNKGGAWYTQPVWIAIGIIALVLIILLIVAAGRRDSTTVVK